MVLTALQFVVLSYMWEYIERLIKKRKKKTKLEYLGMFFSYVQKPESVFIHKDIYLCMSLSYPGKLYMKIRVKNLYPL